ncbi:uncharacterized protein LOC141913171 [Tubulanus polymorphus]|uniref:uncharacterized protein LOC141913171 n=1 Tax=Tubulanus polymorphus TaxID=672921 RepID=UPI003DA3DF70
MEKAAKTIRRSSVRLLSLTGGHGNLNMVISEEKDIRNTSKAFMAAQNSAAQYMMKWALQEDDRAIQDVVCQMGELNILWTEVQREFTEQLKMFKQMFELILEGEKHIDQARNHLALCEQKEGKIKKELKKAAKFATNDEIRSLETKLLQAERAKDIAKLEFEDRIRENEAIKLTRFREGLINVSQAYIEMGKKCAIIHEAQQDIAYQLPDVQEKDIEDIKYTGSGATKQYVLKAKEKIKQYNRRARIRAYNTSANQEPPPPYTPGDFFQERVKHTVQLDPEMSGIQSPLTTQQQQQQQQQARLQPDPDSNMLLQSLIEHPEVDGSNMQLLINPQLQLNLQPVNDRSRIPDAKPPPLLQRHRPPPKIPKQPQQHQQQQRTPASSSTGRLPGHAPPHPAAIKQSSQQPPAPAVVTPPSSFDRVEWDSDYEDDIADMLGAAKM